MEDIIQSRTQMRRDGQTVTNHHHYRIEIFCEIMKQVFYFSASISYFCT